MGLEVTFRGQIRDIKTKLVVSLDKTTQITLEQSNLRPEVLAYLCALQSLDANSSRELVITIKEDDGTVE